MPSPTVATGSATDLTEQQRNLLAALAQAPTEEVAARRLGISPRTLRRRRAKLEAMLGTSTPFQLGMAAAQLLR